MRRLLLLSFLLGAPCLCAAANNLGTAAESLDWQGWLTILIFALVMVGLVTDKFPPDLVLLTGACSLVICGILTPAEFLAGFSRDIIFTIAMLFIVASAVDNSGILSVVVQRALPRTSPYTNVLPVMMLAVMVSSAFLNNTPIVVMMTPFVRNWALESGQRPSKFLIPLSYAAILGGVCTLIGTSSNLVVDGLMRQADIRAGFSFFEITWIGLPCALVGFLYMTFIGHHILPNRDDPTRTVAERPKEFTTEFLVEDECQLAGLSVGQAGTKFLKGELLIEIERKGALIDAPGPSELIKAGDRLIFAGQIEDVVSLARIKGLQSLADPHFKIDEKRSHFSELVLSTSSSLIGRTLKQVDFRNLYGGSVMAVFREGVAVKGPVGGIVLKPGDTLLVLSAEPWQRDGNTGSEFYALKINKKIEVYPAWRTGIIMSILGLMVLLALFGTPMMIASLTATVLLVATRSITLRDARRAIRWPLLILIASSFAFGPALIKTNVASVFAKSILGIVGDDPHMLTAAIFLITMIATEGITNNAAALLVFPIALQTVQLAGYHSVEAVKAVGVTVAMAVSCSFATPIDHQVNTIVYGPGGYKFTDYTKVGLPLSFLLLGVSYFLIPLMWPF